VRQLRLHRLRTPGTFHVPRHFFVTALIQADANAKVAQTLAGHHSASFTLTQCADAVAEQLEKAGAEGCSGAFHSEW
jgi:site-specific recombinase XerD